MEHLAFLQTPIDFFASLSNFSFSEYCQSGCFQYAFMCNLVLGTVVFILSKIFDDHSWGDRLWAFLPMIYAGHIAYFTVNCQNEPLSLKQTALYILMVLWAIRLAHHFYKRGYYKIGGEDYRWVHIKQNNPKWFVELNNFFTISYYQFQLALFYTSAFYYAKGQTTIIDWLLVAVCYGFAIGEAIADRQQSDFQNKKYELLNKGKKLDQLPQPYNKGFLTSGMWKYTRHPNFFCDLGLWWTIIIIGVYSSGLNWTILGGLLFNMIFKTSAAITQKISRKKYPQYKDYQAQVPKFIPFTSIGVHRRKKQ